MTGTEKASNRPSARAAGTGAERSREDRTAALAASEQRLRAILGATFDAIVTIDTNGSIETFNAAAEVMFGYAASEAIGQNISMLMGRPYREHHDAYLRRYFETRERRVIGRRRELTARRKNGTEFPIQLSVSEIPDLGLFTGLIRDITEQRQRQDDIVRIATAEQRRLGEELRATTRQELRALRARVLIVDDHPLFREGLAARITTQTNLEVCGEAADVDEALTLIDRDHPELVIVDLTLRCGHGLDLIKKAAQRDPPPRVLVVSAHDEALFAARAFRAGALGYVTKQETQDKVLDAIAAVLRGERYVSDRFRPQLAGSAIDGEWQAAKGIDSLSDRELGIFELIGRGKSTRSIAEELHLSVHTIETHRENIRAKLSLRNGSELTRAAVQWVLDPSSAS